MNRYILSAAIIISTIACNNSDQESGTLPGTKTNTSSSQTPANSNTNLQPQVSIQPQPGTTTQPATTQTSTTQIVPQQQQQVVTTATPAQTQKTAKGMNPEHGQPGHRCDIPVGAPLNSAPQQKTSATTAQVVQPTTTTTTTNNSIQYPTLNNNTQQKAATTTTTAPGMNPAHGQPGHRCDIAVGAPLNSKPAAQNVEAGKTVQLQATETKKDSTKQ